MSTCRSCGAAIEWTVTEKGKRMPVDAEPVENGTIVLVHRGQAGDPPAAWVMTPSALAERKRLHEAHSSEPFRLFVSHFATCPNAAQHRRAAS